MSDAPRDTDSAAERPSTIPWPPILLIGAVISAVALNAVVPLPWPGIGDVPATIIGYTILGLGIALMAWSAVTFMRHNANIMPHRAADTLITDGPFARFRNPIYLADTLLLLGAAELTRNIWFAIAAAAFVPLITWLAILPEERHLRAKFGDAYEAYFQRSRRWI